METIKLTVRDVIRFLPHQNPRELAISSLLFNLVVPMPVDEAYKMIKRLQKWTGSKVHMSNGVYRLIRSRREMGQAYLVIEVEDLKFLNEYAEVPPPGHGDLGYSAYFEASVIGWRPMPNAVMEMEVVKLTDKALVLELPYKHKTIATGAWPLSRLFGSNNYVSKGTFAQHLQDNTKRIELGQKLKVVVDSCEVQEVGANYRFRLNFADVTPPWRDGSQERRRARASTTPRLGAT